MPSSAQILTRTSEPRSTDDRTAASIRSSASRSIVSRSSPSNGVTMPAELTNATRLASSIACSVPTRRLANAVNAADEHQRDEPGDREPGDERADRDRLRPALGLGFLHGVSPSSSAMSSSLAARTPIESRTGRCGLVTSGRGVGHVAIGRSVVAAAVPGVVVAATVVPAESSSSSLSRPESSPASSSLPLWPPESSSPVPHRCNVGRWRARPRRTGR